ncbi:apolipoprotein N-acyltransferase [Streptomyces sp. NPDC057638]|uniref:apolipoprotein N-acyltransferase n=1 Tax=Streptomyces sp. NPDC057638 TaxID=3346190 RepID=UPI0036C5C7FC
MRIPVAARRGARWCVTARSGRALSAVGCGALPVLAFPAPSLWWFAPVALVPWILLLASAPTARRAAYEGWLGGLGFVLAVHHWLIPNLHVFTLVLAALLGVLWAPWGLLVRALLGGDPSPGRTLAALAAVPSGWLVIERIRSWEGLGGPWGLLGASQWEVGPALRLASVGAVWLVSLLVVLVNTAVAALIVAPRARTAVLTAGLGCALTAAAVGYAAPEPREAGRVRIAVVQPGVIGGPGAGLPAERRFAREEELTRGLVGREVDLVVWGESGIGADLAERPDLAERLAALSRAVGAPLLVNVDARRPSGQGARPPGEGAIFKSSVLIGTHGPTGDRYDKMRLVPFGEYVPARGLLGWATSVGRAADEDRARGAGPVVLAPGGGAPRLGPLVCFESAFPDMSRHLARAGAELLVVQSATSTFQDSWAPAQHASLAALRAAETGRPVVHATLTGVSAVYGAGGARIGPALSTRTSGTGIYDVPLARGSSPYARSGDWPVHAALTVLAVVCAVAGARSLRRSGPFAPTGPTAPGRSARPARTARGSAERPGR